ncbi:MAG: XRE family transcriptional regulator [Aliishimia sp.]
MLSPSPDTSSANIGMRLQKFRHAKGLSLASLAKLTGISDATLSRVENAQTLVSAHNLYILSKALDVDITAFYSPESNPIRSGIRSVSRAGDAQKIETARYMSVILGADLANKHMHPAIDFVSATSLEDVGGLAHHDGEEFLYVLDGVLILHSEHYAPLRLEAGDSIYFDGSMPHAYLTPDRTEARILVINSSKQDDMQ